MSLKAYCRIVNLRRMSPHDELCLRCEVLNRTNELNVPSRVQMQFRLVDDEQIELSRT